MKIKYSFKNKKNNFNYDLIKTMYDNFYTTITSEMEKLNEKKSETIKDSKNTDDSKCPKCSKCSADKKSKDTDDLSDIEILDTIISDLMDLLNEISTNKKH
jgi:hypothetical protein